MDNQNNPTSPPPQDGEKSLTAKLLITLAAVLAIGGLIWVLRASGDEASPPADENPPADQSQPEADQQSAPAAEDGDEANAGVPGDGSADGQPDQSSGADAPDDSQPEAADQSAANQQPETTPELLAGSYVDYQGQSQLDGLANTDRWLNFHADWCPFCLALDENINSNLDQIPAGVSILKVDYDDNQDLRVRYGVTRQTVIVQIDADGNEIERFDGYGRNATLDNISSAFGY